MTSGYFAMSGHAVVEDVERTQPVLRAIHDRMHDEFGISHVTVQVEPQGIYTIGEGRPDHGQDPDRDPGA